jgi:Uncharacterised protein conserved in bacteria (DUF2336)
MTKPPLFSGFDGLMTLSRREGVDIRPTLLRVLTDLYVQANAHSPDEERQFVELTSRLIDEVDDATLAAVRARVATYPLAPGAILEKLGLSPVHAAHPVPLSPAVAQPQHSPLPVEIPPPATSQPRMHPNLSMQPKDAAEIQDLFFSAGPSERVMMLHNLASTPLKEATRIPPARARLAIETLEMAAFAADLENFALEIGDALILPVRVASQIVTDPGGEPLATAARALNMPSPVFQRVLLFLKPEFGRSVHYVYRLSRLYDRLSERSAMVMLAAWRGSSLALTARAKIRSALYDDERQRARPLATPARPLPQPGSASVPRTGSDG